MSHKPNQINLFPSQPWVVWSVRPTVRSVCLSPLSFFSVPLQSTSPSIRLSFRSRTEGGPFLRISQKYFIFINIRPPQFCPPPTFWVSLYAPICMYVLSSYANQHFLVECMLPMIPFHHLLCRYLAWRHGSLFITILTTQKTTKIDACMFYLLRRKENELVHNNISISISFCQHLKFVFKCQKSKKPVLIHNSYIQIIKI